MNDTRASFNLSKVRSILQLKSQSISRALLSMVGKGSNMRRLIGVILILNLILVGCSPMSDKEEDAATEINIVEEDLNNGVYEFKLINAKIIDATKEKILEGMTVVVLNDQITEVYEGIRSDNIVTIDLKGQYLLPGWINAHVHGVINKPQLNLWLHSGITAVRDMSPKGQDFVSLKKEFNENPHLTTILSTTPIITKPGGYGYVHIDGAEEARDVINEYAKTDIELVKISIEDDLQGRSWPMLTEEEVKAITETAHENGLRVTAHISRSKNLEYAIQGGIDEIAHMVVEPVEEEMMQRIVDQGIYWCPTLELWKGVGDNLGPYWYKDTKPNLKLFYDLGGKVVFGTDFNGYYTPFDKSFPMTEVKAMQDAGMTNMAIIQSATLHAATSTDVLDQMGTIESGKLANLIVSPVNPLEDMKGLENLSFIMHKGTIIKNEID